MAVYVILWTKVRKWINSIVFPNYKKDNKIKILGDRKKKYFIINLILLSTKQCLHVNRKSKTGTNIHHVKRTSKKYMVTDKYWAQINDCCEQFLGRWHPVIAELERFK